MIDGVSITGWFTEDFTLAELRTLRAKERIPQLRPRNTLYDGRYPVPTFQEVIDLSRRLSKELGRTIGIYPETKHPTYFRSIGLALEKPLVRTLRRNHLDGRKAKVFVQSFEVAQPEGARRQDRRAARAAPLHDAPAARTTSWCPVTRAPTATWRRPPGCARSRATRTASGRRRTTSSRATRPGTRWRRPRSCATPIARACVVHPYTFRNENTFLPLELRSSSDPAAYGNAFAEYDQFYALGVDGLFSDNPDTAVEARD